VRELLDFIGYLKERADRSGWNDLMQAQGPANGNDGRLGQRRGRGLE